ncbi:MAG: hypothetical protein RIR24_22 [Actinomycetota bacterium]|jgi:hypothetical protein
MKEITPKDPDGLSLEELLEALDMGARPDQAAYLPENLWDEVLPGLWLGGTHDEHDLRLQARYGSDLPPITTEDFQTVVTMYAWAMPADWFVKELRYGIYDGDMTDFESSDLHELVATAHRDWKAGKKVLIRCQAGINRSGLIMALVLIRDGMNPEEAIELMRTKRARSVLRNRVFEDWLKAVNVNDWRN